LATPWTAPRAADRAATSAPGGGPRSNKCSFLDGLPLIGLSYEQSRSATGLNGKGNWSYTWTYEVVPTSVPAPFDAWDLISETGSGQAQVTVEADIMGESAMKSAKMSGPKYSFSMGDDLYPRVVNLVLTVDGTPYPAASSVVTGEDFLYETNAGSNGVTSLLRNGSALNILNTDSHPGNNNGGAGGASLARAVMVPMEFSFGEGFHTVTITGVVKGNSIDGEAAGANLGFSVTQTLHVITPGCGNSGN
jgi:hypothetical protein